MLYTVLDPEFRFSRLTPWIPGLFANTSERILFAFYFSFSPFLIVGSFLVPAHPGSPG